MKKQVYTKPNCIAVYFDLDELLRAPGASRFDNDGDGDSDPGPIVPGDPDEIWRPTRLWLGVGRRGIHVTHPSELYL